MALQVGIVGAGRAGCRRASRLEAYPDVTIAAVADPNRPARDAFARRFGVKLAVSDHRRLAADKRIDVAYICSPPVTHSTIAVDSLRSGKHVICEQPMAVTMKQAEEMTTAAENTNRRLFVALPQRYDPANQEAARIIDAGEIGYPFLVLASFLRNEFDRLNDWHDWMGTWEVGGGGILMQSGSEAVDLLQNFVGEVGAVGAVCTRFAIQPLAKAEDSCMLGIEFVEDAAAELTLTGAARYSTWPDEYTGSAMRVEVYGLDGSVQITSSQPRLTVITKRTRRRVTADSEIKTDLPTDMDRDFLDCILEDKEPLVSLDDAMHALRVILAAYKASQMKRRVETLEEL
ncbi:MAG TPA: Gfo/Idh/MocA family oxidoreductase [Armatimonadota bacterium]|nr:Gfo/Idh/MocA family oxidoreductase [Armatimonadota bacterium]